MKRSAIVIAVLSLLATAPGRGQDSGDPAQAAFRSAAAGLDKGAFDEAETKYRNALELAEHLRNPELIFRSLFYLGLTKQKAADTTPDAGRRRELTSEAQAFYERALALKPQSSGTLLNMSEVVHALGDLDGTELWLKRGLALDDDRMPQFAEKLGDLSFERWSNERKPGGIEAAVQYYRMALQRKNPGAAVRDKYFINVLFAWSDGEPDNAAQHEREAVDDLWAALGEGAIDRAIAGALRVLKAGIGRKGGDAEMLTIVVAGLARKEYDAVGFAKSEAFSTLQPVVSSEDLDATLQRRIKSLLALYQGGIAGPEELLSSWSAPNDTMRPIERPSGLESIRQIARALGYAAQRDKDFAKAEQLYTLALRLDETSLDPATLRDLATVYYAQQKLPQLEQLLQQFEQGLYGSRSMAYQRVDWEQVYQYHRTLGSMYQWLGRNEDAKTQFDHAIQMAQQHEGFAVDPAVRLQRAEVFAALGQGGDAARESLEAAESYARAGDLIRVREAASRISANDLLSDEDRKRFAAILDASVIFEQPASIENAQQIKQAIAVLASNPDKARRIEAERQLELRGVTRVRLESHRGTFAFAKEIVAFTVPAETVK